MALWGLVSGIINFAILVSVILVCVSVFKKKNYQWEEPLSWGGLILFHVFLMVFLSVHLLFGSHFQLLYLYNSKCWFFLPSLLTIFPRYFLEDTFSLYISYMNINRETIYNSSWLNWSSHISSSRYVEIFGLLMPLFLLFTSKLQTHGLCSYV